MIFLQLLILAFILVVLSVERFLGGRGGLYTPFRVMFRGRVRMLGEELLILNNLHRIACWFWGVFFFIAEEGGIYKLGLRSGSQSVNSKNKGRTPLRARLCFGRSVVLLFRRGLSYSEFAPFLFIFNFYLALIQNLMEQRCRG